MKRKNHPPDNQKPEDDSNLTEDVLRDSGKSEEEVRRTGEMDRADDATEKLFGEKQRTVNSPVHRIVWGRAPVSAFQFEPPAAEPAVEETVQKSLAVVNKHLRQGTIYDANGKVTNEVLEDLAKVGYWGIFVNSEYGGKGASTRAFMRMITRMAAEADPTVAGLSSVHGCIGAVDPVSFFGSEAQKKYFLPKLASGESLSAFALTEPGAGSDLTALKTTAVLDGDHYVVNGEKLFITNALPGRTIGLVVMIDNKPAVLVAELPKQESENFRLKRYGIHALRHGYNNGLLFTNFRVPKENLLDAPAGNGLIIAYHGLNYGRDAVCANATGIMRVLLRSITPKSWGLERRTYGESIEKRELVKRRIARLAALIVGADALRDWCSTILDAGYRGELECIIAKIFGSEALKEAAIEIAMKTHGGRSFLEGHLVGDNLHDFLAPCIYEGEGEMLSMALFKSLAKDHGLSYMMPLGGSVKSLVDNPKVMTAGPVKMGTHIAGTFFKRLARCFTGDIKPFGEFVTGALNLGWNGLRYGLWQAGKRMRFSYGQRVPGMNKRLQKHVNFALKFLGQSSLELSGNMMKHQLKLADRQCRIVLMSMRVQKAVTMLVTALHAHQMGDAVTILAADVLCQDIKRELTGAMPTDAYFRTCSKLANLIVEGQMQQIATVPETPIMQAYRQ